MNVHQVFKIWVDRNWRIMITIWLLIYVPIILFTILIHELMRIADGSILVTVIDLLVHYFVSVTGPSLILSFAVYAMILVVINLKNTDITSSLTHIKFKWLWHYFPIVWLGAVSPCLILASLQSGGLSLTDFIIPCIVSVVFSIIVFYVYLNRSHSARFRNRIINYCQKLSNDWKNAEYLLIWIGVFWVAPSYKIHAILGFGNSKPDFLQFGGLYFIKETLGGGLFPLIYQLIPFIVFTIAFAGLLYMIFLPTKALVLGLMQVRSKDSK